MGLYERLSVCGTLGLLKVSVNPCCAPLAVSISHEEWCWKHKSMEVEVLQADVLGVEFRQTGYMLRCALSHAITLVRTG